MMSCRLQWLLTYLTSWRQLFFNLKLAVVLFNIINGEKRKVINFIHKQQEQFLNNNYSFRNKLIMIYYRFLF